MWVYRVIRREGVTLSEAPSEGAYSLLLYAQMGSKWFDETKPDGTVVAGFTPGTNVGWFYKEIWRPIAKTDSDKDGSRFHDDGSELAAMHDECELAIERAEVSA